CDECRRLRVRCDALSRRTADQPAVSCARCTRRRKRCTFEWMNSIKPAAPRQSASSTPSNETPSPGEGVSPNTSAPREPAKRNSLATLQTEALRSRAWNETRPVARTDYTAVPDASAAQLSPFDWRLAQAIYSSGSESSVGEDRNSIVEVCERLDRWMTEMSLPNDHQAREVQDRLEDDSLRKIIACFSARWLPLASREPATASTYQSIIHTLWRQARRDMLRVINRPSYRSMLTLFLFAMTPVPAEVTEDEEADGIFGQVCIHAALQQIQTLRARQRSLQFNGTKVSQPTKTKGVPSLPMTVETTDFITAENIAYWAAITFDTSASLTLNCRSLLSSGLFGFDSEMPWRLVRAGATMFQNKWETWQAEGPYVLSDDRANQIISSATAWKLLAWKLTAVFKEALRDGHDESEVQRAFTLVVEGIQQFNDTYRQPLELCERRMPFLGQHTKFRWFSLMLHYHLSILLLANVIEATDRLDLLADIEDTIADAESVVVSTLMFGLHNTITIRVNMESGSLDHVGATETSVTVPITSIDPYPHHIVAGVQLVQKAVDRDLAVGKISHTAHANLRGLFERTLSHLPQSSKSVKAARDTFSKVADYIGEPPTVPYSVGRMI
ncbi:hypothetical protein BJY01DRAFT_263966, partial [Aspergillus pseudoustus]